MLAASESRNRFVLLLLPILLFEGEEEDADSESKKRLVLEKESREAPQLTGVVGGGGSNKVSINKKI